MGPLLTGLQRVSAKEVPGGEGREGGRNGWREGWSKIKVSVIFLFKWAQLSCGLDLHRCLKTSR